MTFKILSCFLQANPSPALEKREKRTSDRNPKTSDIDLWFIFQMHLARKFILFQWVVDGRENISKWIRRRDLRVFAKSSTDYIKCVLNCFAWERQQLAWQSCVWCDVGKYRIMFAFQLPQKLFLAFGGFELNSLSLPPRPQLFAFLPVSVLLSCRKAKNNRNT